MQPLRLSVIKHKIAANGLGDPGRRLGLGAITGAFRFLVLDKFSVPTPQSLSLPAYDHHCRKIFALIIRKLGLVKLVSLPKAQLVSLPNQLIVNRMNWFFC